VLTLSVATPAAAATPHWSWEGPLRARSIFALDLVRASVRIVRRPGPARLEVSSRGQSSLVGVELRVAHTEAGISVTDIYPAGVPARMRRWAECQPPVGARGDFLKSNVRLDVTLFLPPGVTPSIRVMGPLEAQ
jgi:hypothetical protein